MSMAYGHRVGGGVKPGRAHQRNAGGAHAARGARPGAGLAAAALGAAAVEAHGRGETVVAAATSAAATATATATATASSSAGASWTGMGSSRTMRAPRRCRGRSVVARASAGTCRGAPPLMIARGPFPWGVVD